jgi:hypothetical protein
VALNLGELFGKDSPFGQIMIWGVGQQVIGAVMAPGLNELTQLVNDTAPTAVLSPADLADLVVRTFLSQGDAAATARKSGVRESDFDLLVKAASQALDTTALVTAYRRKVIEWDAGSPEGTGVLQGIAQGHLDPKWAPVIQALGEVPLSPSDAVDAVVENQIPYADGEAAAYKNGVSADDFRILTNTRGNPPDPTQLAELTRRGFIAAKGTGPDAVTFEQGLSESALKDKWISYMMQLSTVLPPEARIRALQVAGEITPQQAAAYYQQLGYDATVAAAYVHEASTGKTTADKALAKADVLKLYADRAITSDQAVTLLADLKYTATEAAEILSIQDMHLAVAAVDQAVTRIRSYYVARKIDVAAVTTALNQLAMPADQQTTLVSTWTIERDSNQRVLTEAQIADAFAAQLITQDQAVTMLQGTGLTAWEALIILSLKVKQDLTAGTTQTPNQLA